MAQKIKVGAVSYLNTKPLIYGFEQGEMMDDIQLVLDYPSKIAQMLLDDEIDIGLVPVAIIPKLKEHYIISSYGIACDGEVASVCLFSDVPIGEIKTVLLDYQSKTSVMLLQVLLKEFWKISPALIFAEKGYEDEIRGNVAGLVIGDRAFQQAKKSIHNYDLGLAWKQHTGLPFIFATWISNKVIEKKFVSQFEKANSLGLFHLDEVIKANENSVDLEKYYTQNIKFVFTPEMSEVIRLFLNKINNII
ncbi:MAG: menaquinone biosynthesis protein [Chitinophagaceae bacterium]|nr:menaquinone biosynthesis protein [Chitinophagaceae bacterium]